MVFIGEVECIHPFTFRTLKALTALYSCASFSLSGRKVFFELALLWSLMNHKDPVAVFHGSIVLNLVCIAPAVSRSYSPTALCILCTLCLQTICTSSCKFGSELVSLFSQRFLMGSLEYRWIMEYKKHLHIW